MNKKLYGYVTTQKFGDFLIPVPFQNIILLDYSRKKNMHYHLPSTELVIPNFYLSLFSTINNMDISSSIGMCSILMLPRDKVKISKVFTLLTKKNIYLHCVYEKTILKNKEDYLREINNYTLENSISKIDSFV